MERKVNLPACTDDRRGQEKFTITQLATHVPLLLKLHFKLARIWRESCSKILPRLSYKRKSMVYRSSLDVADI